MRSNSEGGLTKFFVTLIAVGCGAACSSGPSAPPIDSNKSLSTLSDAETKTLCDWENTTMEGVTCNGKPNTGRVCGSTAGSMPGFKRASCTQTVKAFETCVDKQRTCDSAGVLTACFDLAFACAPTSGTSK